MCAFLKVQMRENDVQDPGADVGDDDGFLT